MKALLAGPSAKERARDAADHDAHPRRPKLLGIEISGGLATVDLSAEFASRSPDDVSDGGVSYSLHGRVAQVVYTLTQFTTVDRVNFKLDGKPVKVLFGMPDPETGASEAIAMDKPVTRATDRDHYSYRDHFLPLIFVDRPAWGAALLNPGRVTGLANVFEAQFRIALLDRNDKVLIDRPVMATVGTGAWGRFDRDPGLRSVHSTMGNAAGLGHLGVQRQAGRRPRVSGLPAAGPVGRPDGRIGRLDWQLFGRTRSTGCSKRKIRPVRHLVLRQLLDRPG